MIQPIDIFTLGEDALLVRVKNAQYDEAVPHLHRLMHALSKQPFFDEIVPAYDSLMVQFDPLKYKAAVIKDSLKRAYELSARTPSANPSAHNNVKVLPICYGGTFGPDLIQTSHITGLSKAALIAAHTAQPFLVCMMGFLPGFTYLSATSNALHIDRHDQPRISVPPGSVGLAGWQTGIYGLGSPGGWRIIGQTPLTLFNPHSDTPFYLEPGDWVQFKAISADEFYAIQASS